MSSRASLLCLTAVSLLLCACGEEKVAAYKVPHEKDPELQAPADAGQAPDAQGGSAMADTAVPTASGDVLAWDAPASWKQKPATQMRKASYSVPAAGGEGDLSVTAFPGDVGGELANVNRWRGQVGLADLTAAELDAAVSRFESNGLRVTLVEVGASGDGSAKAIVGAIVPLASETWFFKLSGTAAQVRAGREEFIRFAHSVRPVGASAAVPPPTSMADTAVPTASGSDLAWEAPPGWTQGPASAMRKASFEVKTALGACEVSVSAFPGDVGGELANVNRWRGQVGVAPLAQADLDAALARFESNGLHFAVADISGEGGRAMVAALAPFGGATWFFKLTGPSEAVRQAKAPFVAFLHSVRVP